MANGRDLTPAGATLPARQDETDDSPSTLVRMAIERGVDVEVLERLVALQERVTERNARAAFFHALSDFQEHCPEIRKSKTAKIQTKSGASFSYTYAPLEEITRAIRPALKAHGLSYSWDVSASDKTTLVIACVLRHIDGHEERASFPVPIDGGGRMSDAQANGAALTYGRRQSLIAVLGLTTADADTDGVGGRPGGAGTITPEQRPGGAGTITPEQAADLESLMDEVGANREKFLRWLGVARVLDIPAADLKRATDALEQKRGRQ